MLPYLTSPVYLCPFSFKKHFFRATNQYLKLEKPQKCIKSGRIIAEKKVLHVSYIYHTNNILTIDYYYNRQQ